MESKEHCSPRCPRCQGNLKTVYVHGHEQCVTCGQIIDDCCQGEVACELDTQTQAVVFTE